MALTDKQIKALQAGDKVTDGGGLNIRVLPTGTKVWQYRYRRPADKKEDVYSIGEYPTISLINARAERTRLKGLIKQGIDPKQYDKEQQQAQAQQQAEQANKYTFRRFSLEWLAHKKKTVSTKREQKIRGLLNNHTFPIIGDMYLEDISGAVLENMGHELDEKGNKETPKECLRLAGEILAHASIKGLIHIAPDTTRLGKYLTSHTARHHPHVKIEEIPQLLQAISGINTVSPVSLIALKLVIILMLRQGSLRLSQWKHIDREKKLLTIPSENMKGTKKDKEGGNLIHIIPLPEQAIRLLKQLQGYTGHSVHLFPSVHGQGKVMSDGTINKVLSKVISKDKQDVHGFRGLASTYLNGYKPEWKPVIESMLSHKDKDSVHTAYNHTKYMEQKRIVWQHWADYLEKSGLKI